MIRTLSGAGLAMLVLGWTSMAFAQTDCKTLVPASPWGPNDQTGATNRVTSAVTKAAAAEIQEGKVVPMSHPLVDGIPLFGSRFTKTILTATTLAPGGALGENQLTYMEDTWLSPSHAPAMARAPQELRAPRRPGGRGEGLPAGRQAEEHPGMPQAVPRQGNGDHG